MKKNSCYEVKIIDDNHNGCGIAILEGIPVFIKGCVCGDVVNIRVYKVLKKFALGEVISFISKSDIHEKVLCPYYSKCGGCNLMHISYDREIILKERYLKRLFKDKFIGIKYFDRFNYRNKVKFHVSDGKLGFYDELSNDFVCVSRCMLLDDDINKFVLFLSDFDLSLMHEVVIRKGDNGLLLYVCGKISSDILECLKSYDGLISIYENDDLLYGDSFIVSSYGDIKYYINHKSFFQVNNECSRALYEEIKYLVCESDRLLDLYCGMASIGIYIHDICKNIVGVEVSNESFKCAKVNIKENLVSNYEVLLGDASCVCDSFDTVIVDPPRSGLSKKVISNINDMKVNKLIYVSCNPSTLKRDINLLSSYEVVSVKGFNMFPGTKHVECVALFKLKV